MADDDRKCSHLHNIRDKGVEEHLRQTGDLVGISPDGDYTKNHIHGCEYVNTAGTICLHASLCSTSSCQYS